jgi:acyl-CoA reductase-like NAD-dependent aldehyde dehydrogenase
VVPFQRQAGIGDVARGRIDNDAGERRGNSVGSTRAHRPSSSQPAGVVIGIAPWNAPVILGVRAIAWPLACGNTVVLKASEVCPGTHRLIGTILRDAGLPKGVINVITHAAADASKVVEALIAHPAVRRINLY